MSIDFNNHTKVEDTPRTQNITFIELQTLQKPRKRSLSPQSRYIGFFGSGMASQQQQSHRKSEKKPGLKERIFGTRKTSRGGSKFDVVRNVEVINYKPTSDRSNIDMIDDQKDIKKPAFIPFRTSFIHGHRFEQHHKPTWCDVCEDFIWGLYAQAVRCQYCRYTCHTKCVSYVDLDCPRAPSAEQSREELTKETLQLLSETDRHSGTEKKNNNLPSFVSSFVELRRLIDQYNDKSSLIMTLHGDCIFDGFIRVHMNLKRPVNVSSDVSNLTLRRAVARTKSGHQRRQLSESRRSVADLFDTIGSNSSNSSSTYDSGISSHSSCATMSSAESSAFNNSFKRGKRATRRLSFYMPKGTYKPLHVTSTTTSKEVIEALLDKYNVTDNPKKFALFEKIKVDEGQKEVVYRKVADDEKPLVLCLSWGANNNTKSFALKENEDGTIQWMNFEIPELNNFLTILQIEEDALLAQIYQKYDTYKEKLQQVMDTKTRNVVVSYQSEC